jgi:MoaA/NifB/PqqE/SkfB family radical SAM enzyme
MAKTLVLNLHDIGCKNNCIFCGGYKKRLSQREADKIAFAELKKLEDKKNDIDSAVISGNDPIEYYDFVNLLKKIKKITDKKIFLQSHCVDFANIDYLKKVLDIGNIGAVQVPVYGPDEKIHDSVTRNPGSFHSITKALNNFKKLGFDNIQMHTLFLKQNEDCLPEFFKFLLNFGHKIDASLPCLASFGSKYSARVLACAPDLKKLAVFFEKTRIELSGLTDNIYLHDMPYCLTTESFQVSYRDLNTTGAYDHFRGRSIDTVVEQKEIIPNYRLLAKDKKCVRCRLNGKCRGITKPYLDLGFFKPKLVSKKEMKMQREHYSGPVGTSPFVYAGFQCNNNCVFCFEKDLVFHDKGTDNLKKEIQEIRKRHDIINFMGREPTLRSDLAALITYAREAGFKQIGITTNGRMLAYPGLVNRLVENGLNQFVITVAGHTPETHDWHTRVRGSFLQTIRGIKNILGLKRPDISLVINIMITRKNYKQLPRIVRFYLDLGVKEINIGHILPYNSDIAGSKKIIARLTDVVPYLVRIEKKFGDRAKFLFVEYPPCVFDEQYRRLSFPCLEENPQKVRIPICKKCVYKTKCDGIPQKYIDIYGTCEFKI